jgi:hypothetical protein
MNAKIHKSTVFSHIVQKRLSEEYENIATEALAFILHSSESARSGLMKFLRGIASDLPSLQFRTQQTDRSARRDPTDSCARPDMCGFDGTAVRVFIENKFWAGLTEKQPVEYLERLAKCAKPSVLLMVVPTERQEPMWREIRRRIVNSKLFFSSRVAAAGGVRSVGIGRGRILALTSWKTLLAAIEMDLTDEPQAKNDLLQLCGLCDTADSEAFQPLSSTQMTDQRTPTFILQLNSIREGAVEKAITAGVLLTKLTNVKNPRQGQLLPQSSCERSGRYACFRASSVGAWLGTEFTLWKNLGSTPLWLVFEGGGSVFNNGEWQRDSRIRHVLGHWASRKGVPALWRDDEEQFAIGIVLPAGEEEAAVITSVVNTLKEIARELSKIRRKRK